MAHKKIIINICGEGEVPGAINLNSLIAPLRPPAEIKKAGPLVQHDVLDPWPFGDNSADEVVGNYLPGFSKRERAMLLSHAWRVLKPGGRIMLNSLSISLKDWRVSLEKAGFAGITFEVVQGFGHAIGVKP